MKYYGYASRTCVVIISQISFSLQYEFICYNILCYPKRDDSSFDKGVSSVIFIEIKFYCKNNIYQVELIVC